MKIIILMIITIVGVCKNVSGQATLPLSRTAWGGAEPTGWTNSGCTQRATTFACSGSDGTIFDSNGDSRTVFFSSAPDQLVFKLKKASMSGESSLLVQESVDGTTWTNLGVYGTATGATAITDCGNITLTLLCTSRYVKWTYTKASGNCDMDDVSISAGSCGCTPPADPTGTISGTTPACTSTTLSYSEPSATTYWQTSATGTSTANPTTGDLTVTTSGNYYVRAYDGTCWSTNSVGPYAVVINTAVSITAHPSTSAQTICSGQSLTTLTVTATGSSLTYLWYSNTVNSNSGGTSLGVTTNTYTPSNTLIGTTYYYCVVSGGSPCPSVTSNVSGAITVNNCQCPYLTAVLINACEGGSCDEGDNEVVFMNSGDYSFTGSSSTVQLYYGSTDPATVGYTESVTTDATLINQLNTQAGCGTTLFYNGNGVSIPADASIMIVRSTICDNAYDWTGLCGNEPIYVILSTDASWLAGGNFVNGDDPGDLRYFKTSTDGSCAVEYNYEPNQLSGGNGAFITFDPDGGAATSYTNTGCTLSAIVLPVTISRFYYELQGNAIMLKWDVVEEDNIAYYLVEKSADGMRYEGMGPVYVTPGSETNSYVKVDDAPITGFNYYRLSSVDNDGYIYYHQTLVVNKDSKNYEDVSIDYKAETITIFLKEITAGMEMDLIGMTGKTIKHYSGEELKAGFVSFNTDELSKGVYVVRVTQKHKTFTKKLIIY